MKRELARFIEKITPARPDVGPPLPAALFIQWPAKIRYNMPKPVIGLGNIMAKGNLKIQQALR